MGRVHRGELAFALLNKFPYASGHLMVAPYRHGSAFDDLEGRRDVRGRFDIRNPRARGRHDRDRF